jgi:hypothetical protein
MGNRSTPSGRRRVRSVIVGSVISLALALVAWLSAESLLQGRTGSAGGGEPSPSPSATALALPNIFPSGDITLFEFAPEFREAKIYDITVDDGTLWLGTGKGLVEYVPGRHATAYRQFTTAPFEWVRHLALDGGALAVDTLTANGNTGGEYAGSHLFDLATRRWQQIGVNVLDQVWLHGELWQRTVGRKLNRVTHDDAGWRHQEISIANRLCAEAYLAAIGDDLWIAQQGTVRGDSQAKAVPCGVLRYSPATGEERLFDETDGLNSGFGRDVAGDAHQVWVSHSINHDRLSVLDERRERWRSARSYGSGNRIALGANAVWLATPDATNPLIRIDRHSEQRLNIRGVPEGFYVGAMAVAGREVWLGLYKPIWTDGTYSTESYLAQYIDF